jgi:zinc transporter
MESTPRSEAPEAAPSRFVAAHLLDGRGGGPAFDPANLSQHDGGDGAIWLHIDPSDPAAEHFLTEHEEFGPDATRALLEVHTRPRVTPLDRGLLVILRGVNLNPGSAPEDMVSLRIWFDGSRVVSSARRRIASVEDLRAALAAGHGPLDPEDLVLFLVRRLLAHIEPYLLDLDERGDDLEESVFDGYEDRETGARLAELRRVAIATRRFLGPQREALGTLVAHLRRLASAERAESGTELAERQARFVEDLDELVARMGVLDDLLASRAAERLNSRLWVLSIVTALFLPLGLLTGLLGINVGGIPLADSPYGFALVVAFLGLIAAGQFALLRRKGWL